MKVGQIIKKLQALDPNLEADFEVGYDYESGNHFASIEFPGHEKQDEVGRLFGQETNSLQRFCPRVNCAAKPGEPCITRTGKPAAQVHAIRRWRGEL